MLVATKKYLRLYYGNNSSPILEAGMQSQMSWKRDKKNRSLWVAKTDEKLDYFIKKVKAEDGFRPVRCLG